MAERKLVFLTTQLPFPPNSGGTIKSYRLIEFFAQHFDLVLCTLLKNDDVEHLEQFRNQFSGIKIISHKQQTDRSALNYLKSFFANKTLNEYRNWNSSFFTKVTAEFNSDALAFVDHFEMYQYLPKDFIGKVVLHEHNAEWMLWERFALVETNPIKRIVLNLEANRIKKKEVRAAQNSTLTFAAPDDRTALINAGVAENKINETYHLGNDELLNLLLNIGFLVVSARSSLPHAEYDEFCKRVDVKIASQIVSMPPPTLVLLKYLFLNQQQIVSKVDTV